MVSPPPPSSPGSSPTIHSSIPELSPSVFRPVAFTPVVNDVVLPHTASRVSSRLTTGARSQLPPPAQTSKVAQPSPTPSPIQRVQRVAQTPPETHALRSSIFSHVHSRHNRSSNSRSTPTPRTYVHNAPLSPHVTPSPPVYSPISLNTIPPSLHKYANPAVLTVLQTLGVPVHELLLVTECLQVTNLPELYAVTSLGHTHLYKLVEDKCVGGYNKHLDTFQKVAAYDGYLRYLQEEFQLTRRLRDCTDYRSLEECHFSAHSFYHFYSMKFKKPVENQGNTSRHSRNPSLNDHLSSHHSTHSVADAGSIHSAQYSTKSQHSRRSMSQPMGGYPSNPMPEYGDPSQSYQNNPFPNRPLRNRAAINHKIKWDGNILKFDEVFQNVHGHLTQVGVNYLLFPDVMNNYIRDPDLAYRNIPPTKGISEAQFEHDREYLFGVLQSVCKYGVGAKHLYKHRRTQDGLAAYITLMNEYAHGGDVTVRATYYRKMIHARWNPNQPLLQYLTNLQTAYVHLSELNETFEDHKQISNTVQNFSGTHLHQFVFNTARNPDIHGNFDQFCRVLQEYAHSENYGALTSSRRQAKRMTVDPFWEEADVASQYGEVDKPENPEEEILRSAFQFAAKRYFKDESYSIPPNAWKLLESLDPNVLAKFQAKRKELGNKKTNTTNIPKQYPRNS